MSEREKKLVTFLLDSELRARIDEFCEKNDMKMAGFIRLAIVEKLEQPAGYVQLQELPNPDLSHLDLAMKQLQNNQKKTLQMLNFLVDQRQVIEATGDSEVEKAKKILLESKPKTYEEANRLISDINTMNEAINQLLQEGWVNYQRKRLIWQ